MNDYNIPEDIDQLFDEVDKNDGYISYSIIDYSPEMSMDNFQSMDFFLEQVNIHADDISGYEGTQVVLCHPFHHYDLVVDAGGLGDFNSHSFDCYWLTEE